ncbi:hypothetical protein [Halobacillus sp. A5]|uniref:hypothetical protein n=1 Tax=Halobacillus sp. A5 TaxID=2880263 RepID=UPI0020A6BC58|nr:hypothetical protein [Halobacillus sp. A5]MCP3026540.1 hypothetical protein [Halobacillus sp. A5]
MYYGYYYPCRYCCPQYWPFRPYEEVDPALLTESAAESKKLMKDASKVLDKIAESEEFDAQLMQAAQISDDEEVERLIKSIGVTSRLEIHYNPDSVRLEFSSSIEEIDCCKLEIALRWRR